MRIAVLEVSFFNELDVCENVAITKFYHVQIQNVLSSHSSTDTFYRFNNTVCIFSLILDFNNPFK